MNPTTIVHVGYRDRAQNKIDHISESLKFYQLCSTSTLPPDGLADLHTEELDPVITAAVALDGLMH